MQRSRGSVRGGPPGFKAAPALRLEAEGLLSRHRRSAQLGSSTNTSGRRQRSLKTSRAIQVGLRQCGIGAAPANTPHFACDTAALPQRQRCKLTRSASRHKKGPPAIIAQAGLFAFAGRHRHLIKCADAGSKRNEAVIIRMSQRTGPLE